MSRPGSSRSSKEPHPETQFVSIKHIGKGSFGTVSLVRSNRDGKLYVMKRVQYNPLEPKGKHQVEALTEVKMLRSLKHPNIVEFKEAFVSRSGRHLCIVMAYCESGDLMKRIKAAKEANQGFEEQTIMDWFIQLLLSLHFLHGKRVIHRDIKPQNIFLTENNRVIKVGDFGVTRMLDHTMAMARTRIGTPYYMSPELCSDTPYSYKSDVWAMGCVLYQLCSLRVPFEARDFSTLRQRILGAHPPPLPDTYSRPLRSLVGSMLAKQPLHRPSTTDMLSMQFVRHHLQSFVDRFSAKPKPPPRPRTRQGSHPHAGSADRGRGGRPLS